MTRGNNFDALRLAGALAVLVSHQFALMGQAQPMIAGHNLGTNAVFMFFAISGYLVAGSWKSDPDGFRFIARRFLRMAPGWGALMLITLVIQHGLFIGSFPTNPHVELNGSLWTLEWEVLCYVVLGVGALALGLRLAAPLAFLALFAMLCMGHGNALLLMFAAGAVLHAHPPGRWLYVVIPLLLAASWYLQITLPTLLAVVPLLSVTIGNASWPGVRSMGRFGDFSYGIYIYAWPVQQFGVMLLGQDQPYLLMIAISLAVTGTLAVLSWRYVEAPALALKRCLRRDSIQMPEAAKCAAIRAPDSAVS